MRKLQKNDELKIQNSNYVKFGEREALMGEALRHYAIYWY